jgi:hypothetical protein
VVSFRRRSSDAGRQPERAPVLPRDQLPSVRRPPGVVEGSCPGPAEVRYVALRRPPRRKRDDFDPYFIAHCDCDWVGKPHHGSDEDALEAACADAYAHTPNVEAGVVRPLD